MIKVPDPLHCIDDFLLDHVFNRVSWWSEYNYGKDAMHLRTYVMYGGMIIYLAAGIFIHSLLLVAGVLILVLLFNMTTGVSRRRWIACNATGRNILRVEDLWRRLFNLSTIVFFLMINHSWIGVFLGVGLSCVLPIRVYFEASDAMPPGYRESKLIFSPT